MTAPAPAPWTDTPFALLPIPGTSMPGAPSTPSPTILSVAAEMANAHNLLLRGLNAIYLQAPHIHLAADITDFTLFALTWADTIHHHHRAEETHFFPAADALARAALGEGVMEGNLAQHQAFEAGLSEMRAYVEGVRRGEKVYDGAELRRCIDVFAGVLTAHLSDEIGSILKLEGCDGEEVERLFKVCSEEAGRTADPNLVLPFVFGCIDKSYPGSANFPPVPFFVPWLNAYWFARKHRGCWRFSPSDHWGRPRPLQFLGKTEG